ncbi:hypothetical protein WJX73_008869 [Symbiochloris irregularis]|uniref:MORN repeat-containing protein n=1 Tax=Symbiochloris irregularis TaxID=706552 RepID=A0AAW1P493_9CHLO
MMSHLQTPAALLALGAFLKGVGLLAVSDAETALDLAKHITLPALALQVLIRPDATANITIAAAASAAAFTALQAGLAWLVFGKRRPPERALLTGASVGLAMPIVTLPLLQSTLGPLGLHVAVIFATVSSFAGGVALLLFGTGGSVPPQSYVHSDGGQYQGQWQGAAKHGLGRYLYPSGARYAGEWLANEKAGRGVYTFAKGSLYEGEWQAGQRHGIGVRLLRSGTYKAGRWNQGDLVDAATEVFAAAHVPLALVALGVKLASGIPKMMPHQARDGVDVLSIRCMLPLMLASAAFALVPAAWAPFAAAAAVSAVAAIPDTAAEQAARVRLSPTLPKSITAVSNLTAIALMLTISLGSTTLFSMAPSRGLSPRMLSIPLAVLAAVLLALRKQLGRFAQGSLNFQSGFQAQNFVPATPVSGSSSASRRDELSPQPTGGPIHMEALWWKGISASMQ